MFSEVDQNAIRNLKSILREYPCSSGWLVNYINNEEVLQRVPLMLVHLPNEETQATLLRGCPYTFNYTSPEIPEVPLS